MSRKHRRSSKSYALVGPIEESKGGTAVCPDRAELVAAAGAEHAPPAHEDVAARARVIWEQSGYPEGQDLEIWLAAESDLAEGRV